MLRIKEVIKEKGLTIKEVASRMNLSSPSLSVAINGNPTTESLVSIANALNVHVSELFEFPDSSTINCPYCGNKIKVSK